SATYGHSIQAIDHAAAVGLCLAQYGDGQANSWMLMVAKPPAGDIDEVQLITRSGNPSAGTYLLGFNGPMCDPPLKYNANALDMENALTALPTVGLGNLIVIKRASVPEWEVWFGGDLAAQNLPQIVSDYSGLNRGSVDITTITEGAASKARRKTAGPRKADHA